MRVFEKKEKRLLYRASIVVVEFTSVNVAKKTDYSPVEACSINCLKQRPSLVCVGPNEVGFLVCVWCYCKMSVTNNDILFS